MEYSGHRREVRLRELAFLQCANPLDSGKHFERSRNWDSKVFATVAPRQKQFAAHRRRFSGGDPAGWVTPVQD